ncbi:AraC family transcriptional regulator [Paenibacillus sp. sptzw28]|uniref:helix-turn-helix domain-containing protein n=1 Tax=Paenibacillus sp. sptzw28 TaxID=715179 RepID=UPI001C6F07FC|nr:helix-turn-helix domain-containing protein [Paenibacillus sp. sptzw28]QYR20326.1 AraC family transcriptional regulator [Paenibacillus sp. sptzw28]
MRKNWYRRLLLSYFPIFVLTVSIIIFLSFIIVSETSRKETEKADRISTGYIADSLDRSMTEIEMTVLKEVEFNPDYNAFLNSSSSKDEEGMQLYDLVDSMRNITSNNDLIQSIYIYRDSDKSILTLNGRSDLASFKDRSFIEKALRAPDFRGWSDVRKYQDIGEAATTDQPTQVISMYKRLPLPFGSQGMIVINVSMHALERNVDQMTNSVESFLQIFDNNGKLIYRAHSNGGEPEQQSGKVLTTLHSPELGWTFESGIKAGQLFAWVSVISYVWIVIGILTVVCAVIYIIYITRRNYEPIKVMMNRIQSMQLRIEDGRPKTDELSLIDSALESLINQTMDYEKEHHENLLVRRRQLFLDMIGGERLNTVEQRLEQLGSLLPKDASAAKLYVVVTEINQYSEFQSSYSAWDQNTLKFALINVFQELTRSGGAHGWAEWISGSRAGLIFVVPDESLDVKDQLRAWADQSRLWVEENLRIRLSFGIGSAADDYHGVQNSYNTAAAALQHKLSLGKDSVVMSDDLLGAAPKESYQYLQMIAELVKAFRLTSDEWRQRLEQIFISLEADLLKDEEIRSLIQALLHMLGRELSDMSDSLHDQLSGERAEEWRLKLNRSVTLGHMQAVLSEYLTDIYRTYVAVSETKSYKAMINEMRNYIEEHFSNPDLSLKHLSDRFQISAKYASYLFKIEFDMKFVDFLVQLRMQRAEHLLAETEAPIQEIAMAVGYANSITFGRVFKRLTGITPGDYRKLKMKPDPAAG